MTEPQRAILEAVFKVSAELGIKPFVIGATARDLIFEYVYKASIVRATEDIDFGLAIADWKKYERLKIALIESGTFKDDAKNEQRIWRKTKESEMKVDLVPFGGVEKPPGQIAFPPNGDFVMSTIGFEEAYKNSLLLEAGENLTVRVASLAGLVLLKFIAYHDRPMMRRRDVQDIFFIAKNYLDAGNEERLYDQEKDANLLDDNFDYRTAGARMLGRDVTLLLTRETEEIIANLLGEDKNGGSLNKFAGIVSGNNLYDEEEYKMILETFNQFKRGIFERIRA